MKLLILGGTAWLGQEIARRALAAGHSVACLARGQSGSPLPGARFFMADRDQPGALDEAARETWDCVVDLTRQPGQARAAAQALFSVCARALVVSSVSTYADSSQPGQDEQAAVLQPFVGDVYVEPADYGPAKVACEEAYRQAFGAPRVLLCRPGLIGGPGDISDRTGWWPLHFARSAAAASPAWVPQASGLFAQIIDVRDLAAWIISAASTGRSGAFNLLGESVTLTQMLDDARQAAGHQGPVIGIPDAWLLKQGVRPWAGPRSLPLWVPAADAAGFGRRSAQLAREAGLRCRPLSDTFRDVLAWESQRATPAAPRRAGLTEAQAAELLQRWQARIDPEETTTP